MNDRVYIVDIDGTIANINHRLHFIQQDPKLWDEFFDACTDDAPIDDVIDVVSTLTTLIFGRGYVRILYLTGRPERVRLKTQLWMSIHNLPRGEIIMRKDGDHRPDTITKKELMDDISRRGWRIAGVFEDRPAVVRVWREMGLTVFQLNHEEF